MNKDISIIYDSLKWSLQINDIEQANELFIIIQTNLKSLNSYQFNTFIDYIDKVIKSKTLIASHSLINMRDLKALFKDSLYLKINLMQKYFTLSNFMIGYMTCPYVILENLLEIKNNLFNKNFNYIPDLIERLLKYLLLI